VFRIAGLSCQSVGVITGGVLAQAFTIPLPIVVGGILGCVATLARGSLWHPVDSVPPDTVGEKPVEPAAD